MKRIDLKTIVLAITVICGLMACGKSDPVNSTVGEADSPNPAAPNDAAHSGSGYDIAVQLTAGGCPDLAVLFTRLRELPAEGWMRRHTVSLQPTTKNEDGSRPRANFLSVLAFSSFELLEGKVADLRSEIGVVEQNGCQSVRITDPDTGARDYLIRAFDADSILLGQPSDPLDPSKDIATEEFEWVSPSEVRLRSRYSAMDFCPDYKSVRVEKVQSIKWGPADLMAATSTVPVDPSYIGHATKALVDIPSGVRTIAIEDPFEVESVGTNQAEASLAELRKLRDSTIRVDMKVCPYRAKPPAGDEPPPPEVEATPTPAPTPDTGAIPDPEPQPETP